MKELKLDFDIDNIRKNEISLLDCQVDLILRSLEFYLHAYKFIYRRTDKAETEEENLRKALITDTYHQILYEYNNSKYDNPIKPNLKCLDEEINDSERDLKLHKIYWHMQVNMLI